MPPGAARAARACGNVASSHPVSNDSFVLGVIEVLWQNNRNANDITLNQVYWDGNASASLTDILSCCSG
jgi:hypothetical protein